MSFTSSSSSLILLLLLVCISLHACNARRLAVYNHDKFHIPIQNEEKRVSVGAAKVESSSKMAETDHKVSKGKKMAEKNGKESLVSVPWRVPHNKPEEKHPGFNLDYSPPKTHPPSHN